MSNQIIEIDEINYSFILTIEEIKTLEKVIESSQEENLIMFSQNELENIEVLRKKGFVSLNNNKLIITSVIDFIFTQVNKVNAKLYPSENLIDCENCIIEIENFKYQNEAMKISIRRK